MMWWKAQTLILRGQLCESIYTNSTDRLFRYVEAGCWKLSSHFYREIISHTRTTVLSADLWTAYMIPGSSLLFMFESSFQRFGTFSSQGRNLLQLKKDLISFCSGLWYHLFHNKDCYILTFANEIAVHTATWARKALTSRIAGCWWSGSYTFASCEVLAWTLSCIPLINS